ncbi:phosphate propanoyltransferase [Limnobaculum zhutongyuii]|uniref:Phosphate propanoyltransferase n=1 Tax=Limnobaculum zhutongyuii TaxID=2498113 RepID=A0A411WMR9_9GAMM|nr:phosphate propanoyltransferase [Limnobaculum zhutongyuii]TQS91033.1 phosphate propanoyltransferase [Limnobaculum zhutongyuii]
MNEINSPTQPIPQPIVAEQKNQNTPAVPAADSDSPAVLMVPVGISNRHVHLSREDMDTLFGTGSSLTRMKAVKQPGQFAAEETVTLKGPKKALHHVRILGPLRNETQIEISVADSFVLGVDAPIKMSGDLADSCPIEIIGPEGSVSKSGGVIVAWRHIHIPCDMAVQYGLTDGQEVSVQIDGERAGIMQRVVVRATETSALEIHVDVEEANAYGLKNDSLVKIVK